MPKIPVYQRQGSLTTQAPSTEVNAASYGAVEGAKVQFGNTVAQTGQQVTNTANEIYGKWEQARNYHQELAFTVGQSDDIQEIYSRAEKDNNIEDRIQDYTNELNSATSKRLLSIQDVTLRNDVALKGKLKVIQTVGLLKDLARKNEGEKTIRDADREVEKDTAAYVLSGKQEDLDRMRSWYDSLAENGFVKDNIAADKIRENEQNARYLRGQSLISIKPYETIKNIDDLGLDQTNKDKLIRYYNQSINIIQKGNEDEYNKKIIAGEDVNSLKELVKKDAADGRVSSQYALGFISKKPIVKPPTELEKVIRATELQERAATMQAKLKSIFAKPDFKLLAQYRSDVIKSAAEGYITDSEMKTLLTPTTDRWTAFKTFDGAVNVLKSTSSLYATPAAQAYAKAQMYGELYQRVGNGEDPNVAAADIIRRRTLDEASKLQSTINESAKIVVIRKSDNQKVRIPADKFDAKRYERIK